MERASTLPTDEGIVVQKIVSRLCVMTMLVGITVLGSAGAAQAAIDCSPGTSMDIGYTIKEGAYIKSSASYTSCPQRPISSAEIVLQTRIAVGGWGDVSKTRVKHTGITTPSRRAWNTKDMPCRADTLIDWRDWRAKVVFKHASGTTTKYSNVLRTVADCRP